MKIFRIRKKFILNPVHPFILRILIQTEKILNRVNPFILKILIQTFEDKNATLSIIHINSGKLLIIRNYTYNYSFTTTPDIKLVFGQSFNGAYAKEKNTIYLSQEFVAANLGNFGAVTGVLLEEFGHYLDSQINVLDAAGDEGDIFSQLVRGESISDGELLSLKAEDDTGFITVSDDLLSVEFSSSNWRVELYNNISRTGTPVLVQDWGDGSQGFSRDWGNGSPHWAINSDNFSLRATTQRYFAPGRHEIQTTSDDGVKVNIAGQTIIDRLVDQATVTNTGIFDAGNGGTFTTIVDYYERGGGANLNFTTRLLQQSVVNLAPNQPQSGQLSTSDRNNPTRSGKYSDDYRLTGLTAGQQVRLDMTSSFDTYLQLVNESTGQVIAENDDSNGTANSQITFTAQSGVSYIARATSYGSGVTGNYNISLASLAPPVTNLGINQTLGGQLSTSDRNNPTLSGRYSDDYRLTGLSAGQQIRLDMTSSFDTYLQLVNESTGQVIAENDDSNGTRNSQINLTVQAGVSYIARATSYSSGVTGNYNISLTGSQVSDWFDQNIRDTELRSEIRNRMTDGSLDRNDMIAIFRNARDGSTIDGNELTDLRTLVNNTDRISMQEPVRVLSRKIANGNIANGRAGIGNLVASSSSSQMDRLIDKWFLGTIRPTTTNSNFTYRFASGSLFQNGISQDDVRQSTALNNCYFMAGLATTALRQSNTIQNMFIDNGDGTFTVRFYDVTNQVADYVTVDKYLPVDTYGRFVYANRGSLHNDQNNELWVALAEKAYAQFNESDTTNQIGRNNNDRNSYYGIEWGFANVALTNITGSRSNSFSDFNLNGLLNQINAARPIIVNSKSSGVLPSIVPSHSYTLTSYDSQTQKFRLFNPRVGSTQPRNIDMIIEQLRLYFSGWIYI